MTENLGRAAREVSNHGPGGNTMKQRLTYLVYMLAMLAMTIYVLGAPFKLK